MAGKAARRWAALIGAPFVASGVALLAQTGITRFMSGSWPGLNVFYGVASLLLMNAFVFLPLGLGLHAVAFRLRLRGVNAYWIGGALLGAAIGGGIIYLTYFLLELMRQYAPYQYQRFSSRISLEPLVIAFAIGRVATATAAMALFGWIVRRPDRDENERRESQVEAFQ